MQLPNGQLLHLNGLRRPPVTGIRHAAPGREPKTGGNDSAMRLGNVTKNTQARIPVPKARDDKHRHRRQSSGDVLQMNTAQSKAGYPNARAKSAERSTGRAGYYKLHATQGGETPRPPNSTGQQKGQASGVPRRVAPSTNAAKHDNSNHRPSMPGGFPPDDKIIGRAPNPRTGVITPSEGSSKEDPARQHANPTKWRSKGDQWISMGVNEPTPPSTSEKGSASTNSSNRSSVQSPGSGHSSSTTDWEDRFVVNMPSAKEPNPPTMTGQQISRFQQQTIDDVHKNEDTMIDTANSPSPPATTPEWQHGPSWQSHRRPSAPKAQGVRSTSKGESNRKESEASSIRYFSPDEIRNPTAGRNSESVPQRPKLQRTNADGSFLGCKEFNAPGDKNLDEVLLFPTHDESPKAEGVSPPIPRPKIAPKSTGQARSPGWEEKTGAREEWDKISQNLKHAQCSRPSPKTMCRETNHPPAESAQLPRKTSDKENEQPTTHTPGQQRNRQPTDDAFITTPTITRTMHSMEDIRGDAQSQHGLCRQMPGESVPERRPRIPASSIPSGLKPGTQTLQNKSTAPSEVFSNSKAATITDIHMYKNRANHESANTRHGTRGLIHTQGMSKSTGNLRAHMRDDLSRPPIPAAVAKHREQDVPPGRSVSDSTEAGKTCEPIQVSPIGSTSRDDRDLDDMKMQSSKSFELAELDGHQLGDDHKQRLRCNITDFNDDFPTFAMNFEDKGKVSMMTLTLVFDIFVLSVAQVQRLYRQCTSNRYAKATLRSGLAVLMNCFRAFKRILVGISTYNPSGSWPSPRDKDLGRLVTAVGQAVVNFIAVGFFIMVVGRAAWYMVLIGSWVVWFTKPFGWAFTTIGRALLG